MYFLKAKILAMLCLFLSTIFYKHNILIGQRQKWVSEEKDRFVDGPEEKESNESCKINSTSTSTSISVSKPAPPATTPILGIVIVVTSIVLYCWCCCCCCISRKDPIDRNRRRRRVRIHETYLIGVIVFALLTTANANCECDGDIKIMCSGDVAVPSGLPCEMSATSLVIGPGSNPTCTDLAKIPNLKEVDVSNCHRMIECVCSYVATCADGDGCQDQPTSRSAMVIGLTIASIFVAVIMSGLVVWVKRRGQRRHGQESIEVGSVPPPPPPPPTAPPPTAPVLPMEEHQPMVITRTVEYDEVMYDSFE